MRFTKLKGGDLDGRGTLTLHRNGIGMHFVGCKDIAVRNFSTYGVAYGGWRTKWRATLAALRFIWIGVEQLSSPPIGIAVADGDDEQHQATRVSVRKRAPRIKKGIL